eukprot:15462621-Alexandrium_andersonii.AAC.1
MANSCVCDSIGGPPHTSRVRTRHITQCIGVQHVNGQYPLQANPKRAVQQNIGSRHSGALGTAPKENPEWVIADRTNVSNVRQPQLRQEHIALLQGLRRRVEGRDMST